MKSTHKKALSVFGIMCMIIFAMNFFYTSYQLGEYQRHHEPQEYIIFDHMEFKNTGHETQYVVHKLPERDWKHIDILYEAYSPNDHIDRIYSISAANEYSNGSIEIHRGITPLLNKGSMNSIRSHEDISPYIPILKGTVVFWSMINVYHYDGIDHSWFVTVTLKCYPDYRTPDIPPNIIIPIFYMEKLSGSASNAYVNVPHMSISSNFYILNIHATGHNPDGEEYEMRNLRVLINYNEIVNIPIGTMKFGIERGGWWPGQGTVSPIRVGVTGKLGGYYDFT